MTTTPDPTPDSTPEDQLADAIDELAGLGLPIMFVMDDGMGQHVPVTEADLDAGIAAAIAAREAETPTIVVKDEAAETMAAAMAVMEAREAQTRPRTPDLNAVPDDAVAAGAVVLRDALVNGMNMSMIPDVVRAVLVASTHRIGYEIVNRTYLRRKMDLADGMVNNATSALDDLRRHLDTVAGTWEQRVDREEQAGT